jgi:hypothetical protein
MEDALRRDSRAMLYWTWIILPVIKKVAAAVAETIVSTIYPLSKFKMP